MTQLTHTHTVSAVPSKVDLALMLNCEYQLAALNSATPMRYNPFLSHWVEAIQRWELQPWLRAPAKSQPLKTDDIFSSLAWWHIQEARIEVIKQILLGNSNLGQAQIVHLARGAVLSQRSNLNISPFIKMLEEEGIYESSLSLDMHDSTNESMETRTGQAAPATTTPQHQPQTTQSPVDFKASIMSHIHADPDSAHHTLTHLPLDLPSLDLITTMLQEGTYSQFHLDAVQLVRDYIQHGLRDVEQMGQVPAAAIDGPSLRGNEQTEHMRGREEQIRAIKLLVLFMRNLVRKSIVPAEELYFEIQEICVRYIWIREVRDFKAFVEGRG